MKNLTIVNEKEKYEQMKKNIRNTKSRDIRKNSGKAEI